SLKPSSAGQLAKHLLHGAHLPSDLGRHIERFPTGAILAFNKLAGDVVFPPLFSLLVLTLMPQTLVSESHSLSNLASNPAQILSLNVGRHAHDPLHIVAVIFADHLVLADASHVAH